MHSPDDGAQELYALRKRRRGRADDSVETPPLEKLIAVAQGSRKILVFSGSGLSASSGMSTFSTKGGLYERAQKKYKLSDGKMLFTYSFFDRKRLEAQAFFADIYMETTRAQPAPGHYALSALMDAGRLHRHYTLNIDGLAGMVGMDTWNPETNPSGVTVEMHGNVRLLVCVECGYTQELTSSIARQLKAFQRVSCSQCRHDAMRFKVMMYEDADSETITPEEVMDLMEEDVKACDLILWVGISFQQSASTVYFRNVRKWLAEAGRLHEVTQAVINPSDEALWNLMTASSNQADLHVVEVLAESDDVLPQLVEMLSRPQQPGPQSDSTQPRRRRRAAVVSEQHRKQQQQEMYEEEDEDKEAFAQVSKGRGSGGRQRRSRRSRSLSVDACPPAAPPPHQQQQASSTSIPTSSPVFQEQCAWQQTQHVFENTMDSASAYTTAPGRGNSNPQHQPRQPHQVSLPLYAAPPPDAAVAAAQLLAHAGPLLSPQQQTCLQLAAASILMGSSRIAASNGVQSAAAVASSEPGAGRGTGPFISTGVGKAADLAIATATCAPGSNGLAKGAQTLDQ